ncbi:2661_t:CDS:2 [Diversispora eburnea]|uniref:2661_t:CDS:1 n=1 Tax=Diversispora eburnea TaxID=1213867 RepID=A0A9N9C0B4_9GLOM|nr:2661_t:CDS:2 [Diversispora eburnea]
MKATCEQVTLTLQELRNAVDNFADTFKISRMFINYYKWLNKACNITNLLMGEFFAVSTNMDTYTIREPSSITAGICPFNSLDMTPLWMFPLSIASENTMIIKPSEKDPDATIILAELVKEARVPLGIRNIVHGPINIEDFLCDDDHKKNNFFCSCPFIMGVVAARNADSDAFDFSSASALSSINFSCEVYEQIL